MTYTEILKEIEELTIPERLTVVESVMRLIRRDLGWMEHSLTRAERERQMTAAAQALRPDYTGDEELTIFTALDSEDFYAQR